MDKERLITELNEAKGSLAEKINETEKQAELVTELEDHVEKLQDHVNRGEAEGRSSTGRLKSQKLHFQVIFRPQKPFFGTLEPLLGSI